MSITINTSLAQGKAKTIDLGISIPVNSSPLDVIKKMSNRDYGNYVFKSQVDDATKQVLEIGPAGGIRILNKNKIDVLIYGLSSVFETNIAPLATRVPYAYPEAALESLLTASHVLSKAYKARERISEKQEHRFDSDFAVAYNDFYHGLIKIFYPGKSNSFDPFERKKLKSGFVKLGDFNTLKMFFEKLKQTVTSTDVKENIRYRLNNKSIESTVGVVKDLLEITCGLKNLKESASFTLNTNNPPLTITTNASSAATLPPGFLFDPQEFIFPAKPISNSFPRPQPSRKEVKPSAQGLFNFNS